jgi:sulfide:quinone oxidoreductase
VYAIGDMTDGPIKQRGLATQQADTGAAVIAAAAGVDVEPQPFAPVLRGLLLTGECPLYLRRRARLDGETAGPLGGRPTRSSPATSLRCSRPERRNATVAPGA